MVVRPGLTLFTWTYPAATRCCWRNVDLPAVGMGQSQQDPGGQSSRGQESGCLTARESHGDNHLRVGAQEGVGLRQAEWPRWGDGPLGGGDADVRTQPAPAPHVPHPSPSPSPGPHRVKGWELKAGHRPLQEELLRGGEGQAQIEGKLGVRVPVRQEGVAGPGVRAPGGRVGVSPGGLRRRSPSFSALGPSWLGVQPHLEHVEDTAWSPPAAWGPGAPHCPQPRPLPPTKTLSPIEMGIPPLAWGRTGNTGHRMRSGQLEGG